MAYSFFPSIVQNFRLRDRAPAEPDDEVFASLYVNGDGSWAEVTCRDPAALALWVPVQLRKAVDESEQE